MTPPLPTRPADVPVEPYWRSADGQALLYCGDATELLSQIEMPSVAAVISDPPYYAMAWALQMELGIQEWTLEGETQWLALVETWYRSWLPTVRAIVEYNQGRAWLMAGPHHLPAMVRMAYIAGWPVRRLWYASESKGLIQFGRPVSDADAAKVGAAWAASSHPPRTDQGILDAVVAATPTEGIVLDPFCGSGSMLLAARRAGFPTWGIEAKPDVCAACVSRLEAAGQ